MPRIYGHGTVALVFLGGTDPSDAAIDVEADEFDDTVSALQLLLELPLSAGIWARQWV